jgi:hypothetical protein
MKLNLTNEISANITFNNSAKVSINGDKGYLVKWFLDDAYYGEMHLNGGQWGAYPIAVGNWKLEFHGEEQIIDYNLNLENKKVLFIYTFNTDKGKLPDTREMVEYVTQMEKVYSLIPYVYFKGSEQHILPFKTLKLNDFIDFDLIIEKNG